MAIPWGVATALNKNRRFGRSGHGGTFVRREVKRAQNDLAEIVRLASAVSGTRWLQTKTWLRIHVSKPNRYHDPINFLDYIADALEDAIGVNDVWFSVEKLDWSISDQPGVDLVIWQEGDEDERICGGCSRVLPVTNFAPGTRSARCRECMSAYNRRKYRERKERSALEVSPHGDVRPDPDSPDR